MSTYQMESNDYLGYHSSNLSTQNLKEEIVNMFFCQNDIFECVRFIKRLKYIIVLLFCLTFSHKYKMNIWKDNCGIPFKLLLVWDPNTGKIHVEVWRIIFQCVWIIIICTEFWKEKWESLSFDIYMLVDSRLKFEG